VLEPLAEAESGQLLESLMPGGLPPELRARIVSIADGNPLFTEELVRMFVDRGVVRFADGRWQLAREVEELEIPGSVHAVLAARLDSLPAHEKVLAQDAAVVGRIFWDAVLAFLGGDRPAQVDDLLRRLRVKELVVPREPSSLSGAGEYGFRHVLIRDVAYDSLPKRDRAEKHLSVARWAERELSDRSDEIAELLASHYLSALRYAEEFSEDPVTLTELRRTTVEKARRAGQRAARLYELEAATRWSRVALEGAVKLDLSARERATIALEFLERGDGYWSIDEAEPIARDAIAAISQIIDPTSEDRHLEASIRAQYASVVQLVNRTDEARRILTDMLDRLDREPPSAARAMLLSRLGWSLWRWGPIREAGPVLERALADARAVGASQQERWALHELGIARTKGAGPYAEGLTLIRQSMDLAREAGDTALLLRCHSNLAATVIGFGSSLNEPIALIDRGLDLARRAMDRVMEGWLLHQRAQVMELLGRIDESRAAAEEATALALQVGDRSVFLGRKHWVAWTHAMQGRRDLADSVLAEFPEAREAGDDQARVWLVVWSAWEMWGTDPEAAVDQLLRDLPGIEQDADVGAIWLARMAFRIRRRDALEAATVVLPLDPPGEEGEGRLAMRRWVDLLGDPVPAGGELMDLAGRFEELRYVTFALDTYCDAAVALARTGGDPSDALAAAERIQTATGIAHPLGPLPETRWIERQAAEAAAST
ncbi:MAG: hypothetical protein H0V04_08715, partial [Chloroflexi bacterium]|nr:hypothetical protein [Chloroflexota bacterium]